MTKPVRPDRLRQLPRIGPKGEDTIIHLQEPLPHRLAPVQGRIGGRMPFVLALSATGGAIWAYIRFTSLSVPLGLSFGK